MKSKHTMSIIKRSQAASIAAVLILVTGMVHAAGPMSVTPGGGGAMRAWSVPYNPVSVGMVTGLQGFLRTESGVGLLAQAPSLGIIGGLSPDSEAHRRIIGALGLSADFEAQLQAAIQASDNKALTGALGTILSAYHSQNAEDKINAAIQTRANDIATAVSQGKMSVTELSAASSELAPFASVSAKAKAVTEMASAARTANTINAAQSIASTLMQAKGSVASGDGMDGVVSVVGQKDLPKEGRLQPYMPAPEKVLTVVDLAGDAKTKQAVTPTMDLDTMGRLLKGYSILNSRLVYGGGNADADLLRHLSGQKFAARGVLEAKFQGGIINKTVYVYLKSEDGSRKVYLYANSFFRTKSAQRYLKSLPVGASVIAHFTVSAPGRLVTSSPFYVEKIERAPDSGNDTSRSDIAAWAYGHFFDDMLGGIVNGGLSEGWGDLQQGNVPSPRRSSRAIYTWTDYAKDMVQKLGQMKSGESITIEARAKTFPSVTEAVAQAQTRGVKVEWKKAERGFFSRWFTPVAELALDALTQAKAGDSVSVETGLQKDLEVKAAADAAQARGVNVKWTPRAFFSSWLDTPVAHPQGSVKKPVRSFFSSWFTPANEQAVDALNQAAAGAAVSVEEWLQKAPEVKAAADAAQARGVKVKWTPRGFFSSWF